ncbi:hypothetical protein [Metallosphaera javensis (ex Hofmann et al. 2022)]|nr:hypothetical protein [Metallosphaera javensis (ex Hofmann et al. 2022)]
MLIRIYPRDGGDASREPREKSSSRRRNRPLITLCHGNNPSLNLDR